MKVLYIGYLKESSGWGCAARDYALALDAAGVDVVVRCIMLKNSTYELPPRLAELESKSSAGCDVCVQHLLPHHFEFNGKFQKNFGLFVCESSHFKESNWADQCNFMDEIIVPCCDNFLATRFSGVTVPMHIVPHATDVTRFERSYGVLEQLKPQVDRDTFLFYAVGEWVRRKNFGALLRAFHTEFDPDENVELVIKSSLPGHQPDYAKARIESACDEIKGGLKLHGGKKGFYKKEIVITDRLTEEGMMKLHSSCDCFVLPSHGEAWCIPAFDAMAMGKTPIVPDGSCFPDWVTSRAGHGGYLVESHDSQVFAVNDSFEDMFTGNEEWKDVKHSSLRAVMRDAFEGGDRAARSEIGRENAYNFTYQKVGLQFQKVLHGQETS